MTRRWQNMRVKTGCDVKDTISSFGHYFLGKPMQIASYVSYVLVKLSISIRPNKTQVLELNGKGHLFI